LDHAGQGPSWEHWFGTDPLGRDLFLRTLWAVRNALWIAMGAVGISLVLGVLLGLLSGFYGGWVDQTLMRLADGLFAFPQFLLMLVLVGVLGRSFEAIFLAIGIVSWAGYTRLVRSLVMQAKQLTHIEAARTLGASDRRLMFRHLLPQVWGPLFVAVSFGIPQAMIAESALSLVGLGLIPPMPSWGNLIFEGAVQMLGYPHLVLFPTFVFGLTLMAFAYVGDGLGELYDQKL
jgi:ABC-type dipeptide/oligopeptide/nickel transport system permease subunit